MLLYTQLQRFVNAVASKAPNTECVLIDDSYTTLRVTGWQVLDGKQCINEIVAQHVVWIQLRPGLHKPLAWVACLCGCVCAATLLQPRTLTRATMAAC